MTKIKKFLPLLVLVCGTAAFFYYGLHERFTFAHLRDQNEILKAFVFENYEFAVLIYIGIYVVVTAFSLPLATLMTLFGGFLFGATFGTLYTAIAATIGASLIFSAARYAFSDWLERRVAGFLHQLKEGFIENAFSYMLTLRLIPLFPFWVVNIVPAFFSVPLKVFAISTFIGILPGTFVLTLAGAGLDNVFSTGADFSIAGILNGKIIAAFVGLGLLSLLPVLYKFYKVKQKSS